MEIERRAFTRKGKSKERCYRVALWELSDPASASVLTNVFFFFTVPLTRHQFKSPQYLLISFSPSFSH